MKNRDIEMMALGSIFSQQKTQTTEYVTKTVVEKRAPTDESIRLAREYEEKIWEEITNRVLKNVPSVNISYVISEKTSHDRCRHLFFKLNDTNIHCKIEDSYYQETIQEVFEAIANEVTKKVMIKLMENNNV